MPQERKKWILTIIFIAIVLSMVFTVPKEKAYTEWLADHYNLQCASNTVTRDCSIDGQSIQWKSTADRNFFLYKKITEEYSTNKGNLTIRTLGIFGHYFDLS